MGWYDFVRKIVVWLFWHVVIPLFALDWIMHKQELMHNIKMKMLNQTTEDLPTYHYFHKDSTVIVEKLTFFTLTHTHTRQTCKKCHLCSQGLISQIIFLHFLKNELLYKCIVSNCTSSTPQFLTRSFNPIFRLNPVIPSGERGVEKLVLHRNIQIRGCF